MDSSVVTADTFDVDANVLIADVVKTVDKLPGVSKKTALEKTTSEAHPEKDGGGHHVEKVPPDLSIMQPARAAALEPTSVEDAARLEHEEAARMHAAKEAAVHVPETPATVMTAAPGVAPAAAAPRIDLPPAGAVAEVAELVEDENNLIVRERRKWQDIEDAREAAEDAALAALEARASDLRSQLRPIFGGFDVDSSGSVSTVEMDAMCKAIGMEMTPEEVQAMIKEADPDESGEVDFDEFCAVLERRDMAQDGTSEGVSAGLAQLTNLVGAANNFFGWVKNVDFKDASSWLSGLGSAFRKPAGARPPPGSAALGSAPEYIYTPTPDSGLVFKPFYEARKLRNKQRAEARPFKKSEREKRRERKKMAHTEFDSRPLPTEVKLAREVGWNSRPFYNVPATLKGLVMRTEEPWTPDANQYLASCMMSEYAYRREHPYRKSAQEMYLENSKLRDERPPPGKPDWNSTPARTVPSQLRGIRVQSREPWAGDAERERLLFADSYQLERDWQAAQQAQRKLRYVDVDEAMYDANLLALKWASALSQDHNAKWAMSLSA